MINSCPSVTTVPVNNRLPTNFPKSSAEPPPWNDRAGDRENPNFTFQLKTQTPNTEKTQPRVQRLWQQTISTEKNTGHITQVIGSTFDAEFDEGHLPEIYNALCNSTPNIKGTARSR